MTFRHVRGGLAALAVTAFALGVAASSASAAEGTFHVLQCNDFWLQSNLDIPVGAQEFSYSDQCDGQNKRLTISNKNKTQKNHGAQFMYTPPPGERIVVV